MRFEEIYPQERYRYSSKIREEIKQVFNEEISSETLRGLFKELKEQHNKTALQANRAESAEKEIVAIKNANRYGCMPFTFFCLQGSQVEVDDAF